MLQNYFKIAIRNILKYKMFSFINIFGLAVAMTVSMLIILMLADQKSYDQFHEKKDNVYRILSERKDMVGMATTPFPLAQTLKADYSIIEETTQLVAGVGGDVYFNEHSQVMRGYFADPGFFKLFSFELEKGNPGTALSNPNSMVITAEAANRLFGEKNPIGKTVQLVNRGLWIIEFDFAAIESKPVEWGSYIITGVIADKAQKSHLIFDVLVSSSSMQALYKEDKLKDDSDNWKRFHQAYTYAELKAENNHEELNIALRDIVKRKYADDEKNKDIQFVSQKLTEITPGTFLGNMSSLRLPIEAYYFLTSLAIVVMILACLNYTNLSIARALARAKEIGVRKVNGAKRKNLVLQFLSESIITAILAMILAANMLFFVKLGFMNLWLNRYLNFDLQESAFIYLIFIGFAVIIGMLAGVFPALHVSKYNPVQVLKNFENLRPGKLGLRKFLSISQLAVSLFFIITSILMYNQVQHLLGFEYGFTSENIINVELQGNDYHQVANELSSVPGVAAISASAYLPGTGVYNGNNISRTDSDEKVEIQYLSADANFADNIGLTLVAGRKLPEAIGSAGNFILVNETAVQKLGYDNPGDILGQTFVFESKKEVMEVVGVLKDFHSRLAMFQEGIVPFMINYIPEDFIYANLKISSKNVRNTLAQLEERWETIDPAHHLKYSFFDEQVAALNQMLVDVLAILSYAAFLAVTIACLGLFGMAIFATERRRKEIGIRKILGATEAAIVYTLSKEFLKTLIISVLIAAPLSYLVNNAWLQNLPNKVEFGFGTVLFSSIILLIIGLTTIGSQTLKAAMSNPVEALRYE